MMTFFVDFETYYDKQVSINELGIHHYLRHYDCDIYMVSIYSAEAGFSYVGNRLRRIGASCTANAWWPTTSALTGPASCVCRRRA